MVKEAMVLVVKDIQPVRLVMPAKVVRVVAMPVMVVVLLVVMLAYMEVVVVAHKEEATPEWESKALLELFGDWVVTSLLMHQIFN